jgi:hypothetical protein
MKGPEHPSTGPNGRTSRDEDKSYCVETINTIRICMYRKKENNIKEEEEEEEEEEEVRMRYIPNQGITQLFNISSLLGLDPKISKYSSA